MTIKPDKKLITKQWYVLSTISAILVLPAIFLQLLLPLQDGVTYAQVAVLLWPIIAGIILLEWLISAPLIILWIKNLSYQIEEDRVTIYKGILSKQQQNIPYRAVTDFMLHRSLYDRVLGIGTIRIQTAGQSHTATGYEGQLSGLSNWAELHQQLRDKLKSLHPVAQATAVSENASSISTDETLRHILEEVKAIRKALENK